MFFLWGVVGRLAIASNVYLASAPPPPSLKPNPRTGRSLTHTLTLTQPRTNVH